MSYWIDTTFPAASGTELEKSLSKIIRSSSLPCSGKIGLVIRTFGADFHVFSTLIPQLKAFVNQDDFEIHFVLDDEGEYDHNMGAALEELGYIVHYEAMPPESVLEPRPYAFLGGKYAGRGYMRSQYAIYFLDQWLDCEVVGIIDSDAYFSSSLTREVAVRNDQVIIQGHESNYRSDLRAVGTNTTFSMILMHRNNFPQFLYRDAWEVARNHLKQIWGGNSFEEAYLKWFGPQPTKSDQYYRAHGLLQ